MDEMMDEELINNQGEQYFLFLSNNDLYALEVLSVREIVEYQSITKVPYLSSYVKGVTNIRGHIVAVIDLSDRLKAGESSIQERTSFAIVQVYHNNKQHDIALMIDEIYEVDGLDESSVCDTPLFGTKIPPTFIKALGTYNSKEVSVLNKDELLKISELSALKES